MTVDSSKIRLFALFHNLLALPVHPPNMDRYNAFYMSHKTGSYDDSHADMRGASHELCLPPEPGVVNSSFLGKSSRSQKTANYGKTKFYQPRA